MDFYKDDQIIVSVGYLKDTKRFMNLYIVDLISENKIEIYWGEGHADNLFSHFRITKSGDLVFQTQQLIYFGFKL